MVPAQCYERVVRVNVPGGHGSGFTIDQYDRQWLVTAGHVVEGVVDAEIEIVRRDGPVGVEIERVPSVQAGADVTVFALDRDITPAGLTGALVASARGAVFSQDAYFLGFPFGLGLKAQGITYPFVKKAIISGHDDDSSGVSLWCLDGINNPGFSGGPVVFQVSGTNNWQVVAVVSGYRTQQIAVAGGTGGMVPTNSGIILAYGVQHAVDDIDAFESANR